MPKVSKEKNITIVHQPPKSKDQFINLPLNKLFNSACLANYLKNPSVYPQMLTDFVPAKKNDHSFSTCVYTVQRTSQGCLKQEQSREVSGSGQTMVSHE
jgi:hypothetical protein